MPEDRSGREAREPTGQHPCPVSVPRARATAETEPPRRGEEEHEDLGARRDPGPSGPRRLLVATLALALAAAGIAFAARALRPDGGAGANGGPEPPTNARLSPDETGPILDFEPASGWHVVTTDPSLVDDLGTQAWASNVPFAEAEEPVGEANSFPDGWPDKTEKALPADGIILVANYSIDSRNPLPASQNFPERALPLTIDEPPSVAYEGQEPDRAQAVVNATVNGRYVSVRIVFGTGDPSPDLVGEAEEELGRLIVASPPETTASLEDFGLRMDLPDTWHGILFRWPVGEPTLHASTVPITDLYDGSSAREALGPDDLFLVLAENYASAIHYEPVSLPVAIRPEDACPTCEILDDGTSPPPGHSLFYRSVALAGRQFDLFVEFGTRVPTSEQFARVNDVLETLQIDPPDSPGPSIESAVVPTNPVSVDLPAGWVGKDDPVPSASAPRVVAAWGTWDFPTGGECGPEPALEDLPTDGALVWVVEYADPGYAGDFIPLMPQFSIDLQTPPARWECAAAAPSRVYLFGVAGRFFEAHVAFGSDAIAETIGQASAVITSLAAEPAA
jgi:hypothetical protein